MNTRMQITRHADADDMRAKLLYFVRNGKEHASFKSVSNQTRRRATDPVSNTAEHLSLRRR
jgi:hypothetical protein